MKFFTRTTETAEQQLRLKPFLRNVLHFESRVNELLHDILLELKVAVVYLHSFARVKRPIVCIGHSGPGLSGRQWFGHCRKELVMGVEFVKSGLQ